MGTSLAYITHPACALHEMGRHHPERPARLAAINDRMIASGLEAVMTHVEAPRATVDQLKAVHDPGYVDGVLTAWQRFDPGGGDEQGQYIAFDPDTSMNRDTTQAALRGSGAVVAAVDLVCGNSPTRRAFCAVRPPGHHACYDRAMGFCFFNNVAVGTAHAINEFGVKRVAIADFDVHHGNGTEDIVQRKWPYRVSRVGADVAVLFCSAFQHPFYPYSGADTEAPNIVNVPLPAGTDGAGFRAAVEAQWVPSIEAFAPEMIFISAGFDGHAADDMGGWLLRESDYAWVTQRIVDAANTHCGGRVVSVLEGGYDLEALGRSVSEHVRSLAG